MLIVGRFTPERKKVLDVVYSALQRRNYVPVLFDFERPHSRDFTETVTTLARLSRFIVADQTEPASLPKELEAIVPTIAIPVLPLLESGCEPYAMFSDYWKYSWVLKVATYSGPSDLVRHFDAWVVRPAERAVRELAERRAQAGDR